MALAVGGRDVAVAVRRRGDRRHLAALGGDFTRPAVSEPLGRNRQMVTGGVFAAPDVVSLDAALTYVHEGLTSWCHAWQVDFCRAAPVCAP